MASEEYPTIGLLGRDGTFIIHNVCNGEIEPIPEHGHHCLVCNRVVEDFEELDGSVS